jgi:two-component system, LuxR family, response regulator FixJ
MPAHHHQAVSGTIIAVVDDDPAVRNSLKFALEVEGFGVRVYPGAQAVLDDGKLAELSCIVVDQNMPSMTGLELVARLRDRAVFAPVILITSQPSSVLRLRARDAGVPIVEKPLLGNALVDKIRLAVDHAGLG